MLSQSSDDKSKVTLELNKVRALVDATTTKIKCSIRSAVYKLMCSLPMCCADGFVHERIVDADHVFVPKVIVEFTSTSSFNQTAIG